MTTSGRPEPAQGPVCVAQEAERDPEKPGGTRSRTVPMVATHCQLASGGGPDTVGVLPASNRKCFDEGSAVAPPISLCPGEGGTSCLLYPRSSKVRTLTEDEDVQSCGGESGSRLAGA